MSVELEALHSHKAGGYTLRFKGDRPAFEAMVWQIKTLQTRDRQWMPEAFAGRGGWWLSRTAFDKLGPLFRNYQEMRRRIEDEASSSAPPPRPVPPQVEQAFAVLHLRTSAPSWLIARVRRFLADRAHPDKGGNLEEMQRINAAADLAEAWARERQAA